MTTPTEPVAWLYESENGGRELVFDCNSEYASRLLQLGYTEQPLFAADHIQTLEAALAAEREACAILPADIAELVLRIGRAQWGQTPAQDADTHGADFAESVRITAEQFDQTEPQNVHGLYKEGTETVICHTGTSPNSPQIARALTGAWNSLHDIAIRARSIQDRVG